MLAYRERSNIRCVMFKQNDPLSALTIPFPLKTLKRVEFTHSKPDNGLDYDTICIMFTFYIFQSSTSTFLKMLNWD